MGFWDALRKKNTEAPNIPAPLPSLGTANSTPQQYDRTPLQDAKDTLKFGGAIAKEVGQGSMRAYAGLASTVMNKPLTPTGRFQEALYGTDQPITLTSVGRETRFADPQGESTGFWKGFDPALGFVVGAVDLIPGGKPIREGATALIKTLAKSGDAAEIATELTKVAPELNQSVVFNLAENIAKTTDERSVENLLVESKVIGPVKAAQAVNEANTSAFIEAVVRGEKEDMRLTEPTQLRRAVDYGAIPENATPDTPIRVYRAATGDIAPNEFVTTSRTSAEKYLPRRDSAQIVETTVPLRDLVKSQGIGDEFVYSPRSVATGSIIEEAQKFNTADDFIEAYGLNDVPSRDSRLLYHVSENPDIKVLEPQKDRGSRGVFVTPGEPSRSNGYVYAIDRTKLPPDALKPDPSQARDFYIDQPVPETAVIRMGKIEQGRINRRSAMEEVWSKAKADTTANPNQTRQAVDGIPEGAIPDTRLANQASEVPPVNTPKSFSSARTVPEKMRAVFTNALEYVQNTEERVQQLVANKTLDTSTDPYEIMTLYHGRVGAKIERGYQKAEEIAEDIITMTGRRNETVAAGRTQVNDYLQALHAPERNAALGDGAAGMTTAEAAEIVANTPAAVKRVAEKALALHRESLELLKESGVIGDELYTTLRTKYQNHVPLQRVMDEADDIGAVLSGKGFDVKSTGLKRAVGSKREVADILTNIVNNYEQAVLRSEKNIVDRATLAFVRNNEEALSDIMAVRKPKAVGQDFNGKPMLERTNDPRILQLFEDGRPVWIEFKDAAMATAFRGVGREKIGALLNVSRVFVNVYSMLATRFNPEFALPNKIRDLQETMTFLASQGDVGFRGAAKMAVRDPKSMKDVLDAVRGADTPGARMYQEMKSLGGTTGGFGLSTRKQTELNIDSIVRIAKSRPRQAAQKLIRYVDDFNTVFEDSTRLSVYKTALEQGATKERAAFLAKEASINFNRMGQGGPVINALWMFGNAAIQGTVKTLRALSNPKVAATVGASITTAIAAVSEWNDQVDPEWRDKVTEWDRRNSLPIMLPTDDGSTRYFVIPVSWGLKPIYVMATDAYDILSGRDISPTDALNRALSSVIMAYNPVGGTDITSALTPTIADLPVEIARNQAWSGSLIRPMPYNNQPRDILFFDSLEETAQGRFAISTTKALQENYGIAISPADLDYVLNSYMGGAGRAVKKTFETAFGAATGDMPPADEYPFVSRFYRERTAEETGQGAGGEIEKLKEKLSDQARERFYAQEEAEAMYKEFKAMPQEQAVERFEVLRETNPDVAQRIIDIHNDKAKNLTYEDRLIKSLGVENGERARFLVERFNELKNQEEKAKLWEEYTAKGIITNEVGEQINYLLSS